jgi:tRNA-dihydrouridine synthase 2
MEGKPKFRLTWLYFQIVSTLVRNANKPITCKIRLLNTLEDTLDLVKTIEQLGASALAVHARFIPQRPHEPAHLDWLPHITSALSIPVIANGDVFLHEDIANTREITGSEKINEMKS